MANIQSFVESILVINSFTIAVWLCPIAFTLHVLEEHPRFTLWAQRYINPNFTRQHYLKVHLSGIVGFAISAFLLWLFPTQSLVFLFFAFMLTPAFFCNVFFHAGATLAYRSYSPGLITAIVIYLPLYALLLGLALSAGLLTPASWLTSTSLAALFHAIEVRHNVFRVGARRAASS